MVYGILSSLENCYPFDTRLQTIGTSFERPTTSHKNGRATWGVKQQSIGWRFQTAEDVGWLGLKMSVSENMSFCLDEVCSYEVCSNKIIIQWDHHPTKSSSKVRHASTHHLHIGRGISFPVLPDLKPTSTDWICQAYVKPIIAFMLYVTWKTTNMWYLKHLWYIIHAIYYTLYNTHNPWYVHYRYRWS